ncbi:efflux RND transporter periplasmic adaptor subunit [Schlesneria sp. T3-172]|uniref:efflux RND transporter periplasmic adaptor subunit n=1 Tax=Schlesneria sphaerica TaxID=3373610 RepID=UPI0037CBF95F
MAKAIRKRTWIFGAVVAAGAVGAINYFRVSTDAAQPAVPHVKPATAPSTVTRVTTTRAQAGGAARQTSLPCSAHWHDHADLFAKVSGYLEEQNVDIGSPVEKGQVLSRIAVPELESDIEHAEATREQTLAAVKQAEARKAAAVIGQRVAEATHAKAIADRGRWVAEHTFREKEYQRFKALNKSDSVQAALVDEKLFQLQSVEAGVQSAEAAVLTSREQIAAAQAQTDLADADVSAAKAHAHVATAALNKAKLYASFAEIVSPYDGVITVRNYHRGDFIRSAEKGNGPPMFVVARTSLVRVVVYIPDKEVPYAHVGDAVSIEFDSLPGRVFAGTLSRIAYSEDRNTRSMRAEVDLPNEDGAIVDQMYGRMQIQLEPSAETLTLPSVCLVGDLAAGKGQVFIVRDGVARKESISIGAHDGVNVEILDGVTAEDNVIVRPPAGLSDGTEVHAEASRS